MGYAGKIIFPDQTSYLSLFLEISKTFTKTVAQLYIKLIRVTVPTSASLVNTKILLDEANGVLPMMGNSLTLKLVHATLGQHKHLKVLLCVKAEDAIMSWLEMCKTG